MSAVDLPRRLAFHAMLGRYAVTRGEARAWSDEEAASYLEHGGIVFRRLAFVVEDTRTLGRRVSFPASEKGQDARCVWFVLGTGRDESEHAADARRGGDRADGVGSLRHGRAGRTRVDGGDYAHLEPDFRASPGIADDETDLQRTVRFADAARRAIPRWRWARSHCGSPWRRAMTRRAAPCGWGRMRAKPPRCFKPSVRPSISGSDRSDWRARNAQNCHANCLGTTGR